MNNTLNVDMDNGRRYRFTVYTNYFVDDKRLVIENNDQWVGSFELAHLVGFYVEYLDRNEEDFDIEKRIRVH